MQGRLIALVDPSACHYSFAASWAGSSYVAALQAESCSYQHFAASTLGYRLCPWSLLHHAAIESVAAVAAVEAGPEAPVSALQGVFPPARLGIGGAVESRSEIAGAIAAGYVLLVELPVVVVVQ